MGENALYSCWSIITFKSTFPTPVTPESLKTNKQKTKTWQQRSGHRENASQLSPELLVTVHLPPKCSDWHNLHNVGAVDDLVLSEVRP